jgi:hypothetical protein
MSSTVIQRTFGRSAALAAAANPSISVPHRQIARHFSQLKQKKLMLVTRMHRSRATGKGSIGKHALSAVTRTRDPALFFPAFRHRFRSSFRNRRPWFTTQNGTAQKSARGLQTDAD